ERRAAAAQPIAGPGGCLLSTWPGNKYQTISGTSMASPHVAGVVALCFGEKGAAGPCTGLAPAQVIAKMRANAAGHTASNPAAGFVGDPSHPIDAYYGYLAWAGAVDTVAPVITSVSSSAVTHEAARITWTTDENADSQVEYGTTVAYGSATQIASAFVTSHTVDLSGRSPATPSQGTCSTAGQVVSCNVGTVEVGGPTSQTLADHPSGFWRLGDPAGSTSAADASGNGLVGAIDPGVTLGQPGALSGDSAATFSGSGPAVTVAASARLELTNAVSVEAWARPT